MISITTLFELHPQNKADLKKIGKGALWGAAFGGPLVRAAQYALDPDDSRPFKLSNLAGATIGGSATGAGLAARMTADQRAKEREKNKVNA